MSTRATYEIDGETFYIHHDGYPSGAAAYFANMIEAMTAPASAGGIDAIDDRRGGARFAFIRGNMRAEPTESHDAHGDTEHRWRIAEHAGGLVIQGQTRTGFDGYHWSAWSAPRDVADFINAHYPGLVVAIESPDVHWKRRLYATIEQALAIAETHRRIEAGFADGNPNKPHHAAHAEAWERAARELIPLRVRYLEKLRAEAEEELAKGRSFGRDYYERQLDEIRRELETLRAPIGVAA